MSSLNSSSYTIDEVESMLKELNIDLREFSISDIIRLSHRTPEEVTKEMTEYEHDRLVNVSKEMGNIDFSNLEEGE
jgi:NH3-dependent NAD+ synthetase